MGASRAVPRKMMRAAIEAFMVNPIRLECKNELPELVVRDPVGIVCYRLLYTCTFVPLPVALFLFSDRQLTKAFRARHPFVESGESILLFDSLHSSPPNSLPLCLISRMHSVLTVGISCKPRNVPVQSLSMSVM